MKPDFSGYATKANLKCSDGRTIMSEAFKHMDGQKVPLVWQHGHNDPSNVLGYAVLEHRADGVYAYGHFNDNEPSKSAKTLVQHGDIVAMSIYANRLVERSKQVMHGVIREVSLVLSGANPGALIDNVNITHSDNSETILEDEAVIYTGLSLEHSDTEDESTILEEEQMQHADGDKTVKDVFESFTKEQKDVVYFMIGEALKGNSSGSTEKAADEVKQSDEDDENLEHGESTVQDVFDTFTDAQRDVVHFMLGEALKSSDVEHSDTNDSEGTEMTHNVFENNGAGRSNSATLTHSQLEDIVKAAKAPGGSFKDAVLAHAQEYGIEDINLLFPDAKALSNSPEFISRRMEWVDVVLKGTKHSPFAKIKSLMADITAEEARAKGYIKGNEKKDEVIKLLRRTTSPATIYKKQKLDRDDILDITDMDVVNWLKAEMRLMIEEEIARAILVGDGRSSLSEDKVKDPEGAVDGTGIRSILNDSDLYAIKTELPANISPKDSVKGLVRARSKYRGSGKPTLFISDGFLTDIMLEEDRFGRALYETEQVLADKLRVGAIVTVDLFDEYDNVFAIMVSLQDYTIGSNKGGELTSFEDFDIDFNQHKYLQETRLSGGLTKPYSAIVVSRAAGTEATPVQPSFDVETSTITIPDVTGVVYTIENEVVTGDVEIDEATEVEAHPASDYFFPSNVTRSWTFTV